MFLSEIDFEETPLISTVLCMQSLVILIHYTRKLDRTVWCYMMCVYGTILYILWLLTIHSSILSTMRVLIAHYDGMPTVGYVNAFSKVIYSEIGRNMIRCAFFLTNLTMVHFSSMMTGLYGYPLYKQYLDSMSGISIYPDSFIRSNEEEGRESDYSPSDKVCILLKYGTNNRDSLSTSLNAQCALRYSRMEQEWQCCPAATRSMGIV